MRKIKCLCALSTAIFMMGISNTTFANNQDTVDACIQAWGKIAPFKTGTPANKTLETGVKVFGIGSNTGDLDVTSKPSLVLVLPSVNVLGKNTIKLQNPNGWYCFKSNVSVLGKIAIEVDCKAHVANSNENGATVLGADESSKGVAVLGSLRVTKMNCGGATASNEELEKNEKAKEDKIEKTDLIKKEKTTEKSEKSDKDETD